MIEGHGVSRRGQEGCTVGSRVSGCVLVGSGSQSLGVGGRTTRRGKGSQGWVWMEGAEW